MKTPTLPPLPPTPPAPSAALAVGQVLPARVLSPAEAKELVAQARETVVETTLGLARARPLPPFAAAGSPPTPAVPGLTPAPTRPLPAEAPWEALLRRPPAASPTPPGQATAPVPAPAAPEVRVQLQVLSLNPLRVRVLPPDTPVPAHGRLPVPAELPPDAPLLQLNWLPARQARANLVPTAAPGTPTDPGLAKPASRVAPSQAPGDISASEPGSLPPATRSSDAPKAPLEAEVHALLRRLLPRQQAQAEALPELARLLPRLLRTAAPQAGRPAHPALALAGPLLREALQALPTPRALAAPTQLALVLSQVLTGRAPRPPEAPRPEAPPVPQAHVETEAAAEPARSEHRPNAPDWPGLASALRVLVQAVRLPPPAPPPSAPTPTPSPSATAEPPPALGLEPLLRQLLQLFRPVDAEAGLEPALRAAQGERPEARPAAPAETGLLEQAVSLTERLAARSQVQQLQNAGQPQAGGTLWQLELPVRDGRDLDFVEFRVEERDASDTASATAGAKPWSASLRFDFPGLGPFRAVVHWHQARIATRLFAERPETVALINGELPWLATALQAAGLDAEIHACERAALKAGRVQQAQGLLDLRI